MQIDYRILNTNQDINITIGLSQKIKPLGVYDVYSDQTTATGTSFFDSYDFSEVDFLTGTSITPTFALNSQYLMYSGYTGPIIQLIKRTTDTPTYETKDFYPLRALIEPNFAQVNYRDIESWNEDNLDGEPRVSIIYDQSGNERHAVPQTISNVNEYPKYNIEKRRISTDDNSTLGIGNERGMYISNFNNPEMGDDSFSTFVRVENLSGSSDYSYVYATTVESNDTGMGLKLGDNTTNRFFSVVDDTNARNITMSRAESLIGKEETFIIRLSKTGTTSYFMETIESEFKSDAPQGTQTNDDEDFTGQGRINLFAINNLDGTGGGDYYFASMIHFENDPEADIVPKDYLNLFYPKT